MIKMCHLLDVFNENKSQTIQRTVKTDFDGKKTYSDWLIVPGSENKQEIRRGMDVGHYAEYEKEIVNYVIE